MTRLVRFIPIPDDVPPHAGIGFWFIDPPGDHPFWDQYVAALVHLRSATGVVEPVKHGDYVYEWLLFAIDPEHRLPDTFANLAVIHLLEPPNCGYQFNAEHDAAALERVERALNEAPSLDIDYRYWFNQ